MELREASPLAKDPAPAALADTARIRLLLVEDDAIDQMAFRRFVQKEGLQYDYRIANSVKTAIGCLSEGAYDIVVSDYHLGDGTVFDFIDRVGGIPLIVVTGTGSEATAVEAMKKGAVDYIVKDPDQFHLRLLSLTIAKALSARKLAREKEDAEEKRDQLIRELAAANRDLREFAQVLSHDLKAPLRSIHMLAEWLESDYGDRLDDEGREKIRLLSDRARMMGGLIDGVLRYSRIGCGNGERSPIDLEALVIEAMEFLAIPPEIQVVIETPLPSILGEKVCLQQIFQNLIGNAAKFMDKEPGLIMVGWTDRGDAHEFYVDDNGPGIEEAQYERIFQMFQTIRSGADAREGTGLGLAIVRKLVQAHGGTVWLESRLGQGSRFYFSLPKSACASAAVPAAPAEHPQPPSSSSPTLKGL